MAFYRTVARPSQGTTGVLHWTVQGRTVALCGARGQVAANRAEKWAYNVCLKCFEDERLSCRRSAAEPAGERE